MTADDQQRIEWEQYVTACEARNECPHSNLTFTECKAGLCDCVDYPQHGVSQK